ncbi:dipeptide ABC transporter ATP-binding protein [Nitrosococcus watsonii]|nr:dipeptide ABC transporter ATP-binding protein [Nitrosococcus watsonii]
MDARPWEGVRSVPLTESLLRVEGLKTWFETSAGTVRAVDGVDFEINPGETFVLLGESGCGKSMTALSVMRLIAVPPGHITAQRIVLGNRNLLELPERAMRKLRGRKIAMIFQEPQTSLNPVFTVGDQIGESLRVHLGLRRSSLRQRVLELLEAVGIPHPRQRIDDYPHQFSGGMRQRVMIAMALAGEPELLIADEPTTALDVTIQTQILELLKGLQRERGLSILLITHDLGVVSQMADRIGVMYAGHLVEQASRERFFTDPLHPYSRKLFEALPTHGKRDQRLNVIQGSVPPLTQLFKACRFVDRCDFAWEACRIQAPKWMLAESGHHVRCHLYDPEIAPSRPSESQSNYARSPLPAAQPAGQVLLKVKDLKVYFPIRKGILRRMSGHIKAVDGVSLEIRRAETLALVGESGCGKTTTGKGILQLLPVTAGSVRLNGEELTRLKGRALRQRRADFQVIFQDPFASMNPRMTVADIVEEGMIVQRVGGSAEARQERVAELLQWVGLPAEARDRYPHEFSGGQRQRICIARALAVKPKLIVCDEPTSALDVSVQAQILNLLREVQHELGLSYLFITHNLAVVEYLAHRIAVMHLGRIVEEGTVAQVLQQPQHSYTKMLLAAVPSVERD